MQIKMLFYANKFARLHTIIIDGSGITLKGKVTVKGNLSIIGGALESPAVLSLAANDAKPICEVCEAMKNQKQS